MHAVNWQKSSVFRAQLWCNGNCYCMSCDYLQKGKMASTDSVDNMILVLIVQTCKFYFKIECKTKIIIHFTFPGNSTNEIIAIPITTVM